MGALDKPTSGQVLLENEDVSTLTSACVAAFRLEKLGFVFQAYNLIPVLTAMENVEFSMMLLGMDKATRRARALEVMRELGIEELAYKRPNEMSGGQQQRVAVARAIVNKPSIVLADEPTANLDTHTGAQLLDIMENMNHVHNLTFIFSSHDPQVIDRARRLILLRDGSVEKDVSGTA